MQLNANHRSRSRVKFSQACSPTKHFISPALARGDNSSPVRLHRQVQHRLQQSTPLQLPDQDHLQFHFQLICRSSSVFNAVSSAIIGPLPLKILLCLDRRSQEGLSLSDEVEKDAGRCFDELPGRALTIDRPCKTRKIKCGEEKPKCHHCERQGETCDYSIRLNWEGRTKRKSTDLTQEAAKTLTTPIGGPRPGVLPRPLSEPALGGSLVLDGADSTRSQIPYSLSGSLSEVSPNLKTENDRDVYSLEAASKSHIIPLSSFEVSSFAPVLSPRTITDPRVHHDGRLAAGGEDESVSTPMSDISFVGMHGGQQLGFRDQISASQLSRIRDPSSAPYPSPTDSNLDSPPLSALQSLNFSKDHRHSLSNGQMPPPSQHNRPSLSYGDLGRNHEELSNARHHTPKRLRMSPPRDVSQRYRSTSYSGSSGGPSLPAMPLNPSPHLAAFRSYSPSDCYGQTQFTSAVSSMRSGANQFRPMLKALAPPSREQSPDRRLSVSSLLADPLEGNEMGFDSGKDSMFLASAYDQNHFQDVIKYGVDRGFPDIDLPLNKDDLALDGITPTFTTAGYNFLKSEDPGDEMNNRSEFGFGLNAVNSAHGEGGYYARPVPVSIPRSLGGLPAALLENPMNLLYFHHFLNHTARILVPHDCSENPFKSILPQSKSGALVMIAIALIRGSGCEG